jgi:hypothetical protein
MGWSRNPHEQGYCLKLFRHCIGEATCFEVPVTRLAESEAFGQICLLEAGGDAGSDQGER